MVITTTTTRTKMLNKKICSDKISESVMLCLAMHLGIKKTDIRMSNTIRGLSIEASGQEFFVKLIDSISCRLAIPGLYEEILKSKSRQVTVGDLVSSVKIVSNKRRK